MKILTLFIDMIRANRLSVFNENIKIDTPLDNALKQLGGTIFTKCYTPGPDTPRGISSFLSGEDPYKNGCSTRLKWPEFFLNNNYKSIFDIFIEQNYEITCYSSPKERANGLFPKNISELDIHNSNYNLDDYLSDIQLKNDHFIFISIPDFHYAFDDFGYNLKGEKEAYKTVRSVYDIVFKNFDKDDFDHIIIFSDHGFKFSLQSKLEPPFLLLNDDRTNNILIHRKKFQNELIENHKLCSLSDLYATYQDILKLKIEKGISLFSKDEREFVIIEDHISFEPKINQNIELWGVVTKEKVYIRTLDSAILIDKKTQEIESNIIQMYDKILSENSTFKSYIYEYSKIFSYKENIKSKSYYMNGKERVPKKRYYKFFFMLIDLMKSKTF